MIKEDDYVITKNPIEVTITVHPNGRVYKREYNETTKQWWIYFTSKYGLFAIPEEQLIKIDNDYVKYGGNL